MSALIDSNAVKDQINNEVKGQIKGQVVGGSYDTVIARQKSDQVLEIGELVAIDVNTTTFIFQVIDLKYASQVPQQTIEYVSGMDIEENASIQVMDKELRYYTLVYLKSLLAVDKDGPKTNKSVVPFFSQIRQISTSDVSFLTRPKNPLFLGNLRSGTQTIPFDIYINGFDAISHHVLIAATTGRGKSNLTSCILWNMAVEEYAGILVLDPHDEYYGRNGIGLKDHPQKSRISYYTPYHPPPGASTLSVNISLLKPEHFQGALSLTDAQSDALYLYYRKFKDQWISKLLLGDEVLSQSTDRITLSEVTVGVLRRKIMSILSMSITEGKISSHGIFTMQGSQTIITDICSKLENSHTVIVDTSHVSGNVEILVGSMIAHELFSRYRFHKLQGVLDKKPVIGIVLEEAPRVIGVEALKEGPNVFASIAREGRKFKIGLIAITQLPSLIPKEILANMNTKIILGIEMNSERQAIIESAAQDLSSDSKNIAALDKGEAIVSSTFCRFALPIKIPLFKTIVDNSKKTDLLEREKNPVTKAFPGLGK